MSKFVWVKEVEYGDALLVNIDSIAAVMPSFRSIIIGGVHGRGNGLYTLTEESFNNLLVIIEPTDSKEESHE